MTGERLRLLATQNLRFQLLANRRGFSGRFWSFSGGHWIEERLVQSTRTTNSPATSSQPEWPGIEAASVAACLAVTLVAAERKPSRSSAILMGYSRSLESKTSVTGPSLTKLTFIIAPNVPACIGV